MEFKEIMTKTVIKGKDLQGSILCKVLPKDMIARLGHEYKYKIGVNEDIFPLDTEKEDGNGLHFFYLSSLANHLRNGDLLAFVSIPDDEDVYVNKSRRLISGIEFRTHRLIVRSVMSLSDPATWEYLFHLEYRLDTLLSYEVRYLTYNGHLDALKYIYEKGADISSFVDEHVRDAAYGGHLDIIKFLIVNVAKIRWGLDDALKWAASKGHLDTVEFLVSQGSKVTASGNYALRRAAEFGHLQVVKFLCEHGADVTAHRNDAIKCAAINNHVSVVRYLHEQGADIKACKIKRVYGFVQDKVFREKNKEYSVMYEYLFYAIIYGPCYCIEQMARGAAKAS